MNYKQASCNYNTSLHGYKTMQQKIMLNEHLSDVFAILPPIYSCSFPWGFPAIILNAFPPQISSRGSSSYKRQYHCVILCKLFRACVILRIARRCFPAVLELLLELLVTAWSIVPWFLQYLRSLLLGHRSVPTLAHKRRVIKPNA
jgi:hypothetical protein